MGMGLVEVVIAVGLFVTLAAGVAQLFVMSARSLVGARHRTSSLILTVDTLERLRASAPPAGTERTEYLDRDGRVLGSGLQPPAGTMFVRRWSVGSKPGLAGALVATVSVAPLRPGDGGFGGGGAALGSMRDGARLVTLLSAGA